jgi:hypothetical protein
MQSAFEFCLTIPVGILLLLTTGCGGRHLVGVEGTVKLKGQPLDNVRVEFLPELDGPRSSGVTDAQGKFTLMTDEGEPGAAVGKHKVVLRDLNEYGTQFVGRGRETEEANAGMIDPKPARFAKQLSDVRLTPLVKDVADVEMNTIDIDLGG